MEGVGAINGLANRAVDLLEDRTITLQDLMRTLERITKELTRLASFPKDNPNPIIEFDGKRHHLHQSRRARLFPISGPCLETSLISGIGAVGHGAPTGQPETLVREMKTHGQIF